MRNWLPEPWMVAAFIWTVITLTLIDLGWLSFETHVVFILNCIFIRLMRKS